MKWMGVAVGGVILGLVLAVLIHTFTALTPTTFLMVAVLGSLLMFWTLGRLAHAAGSIEVRRHNEGGAD